MEIFAYICTLVLSLVSLYVGLGTGAFGLLDDPLHIQFGSFATSLVIIIFGERIAAGLRDRRLRKHIGENRIAADLRDTELKEYIDGKMTLIPTVNVIKQFSNCDYALSYITSRLYEAQIVLNTRISEGADPSREDINKAYNRALKNALNRELVFKDIISQRFTQIREELVQYARTRNGKYTCEVLKGSTPSFLNFTVLDYGVDEELIIGWATSRYMGLEQNAYLIRDKRVINYFRQYHQALSEGSQVQ